MIVTERVESARRGGESERWGEYTVFTPLDAAI